MTVHQHPHPPRPPLLPVSVAARGRDYRARRRPAARRGQERHRQRRVLPGTLSGRAADARRADARVAVAGGGDSAAAARGRAAQRPRLPARHQRRQVPPPGRPRRSAAARDHARAAARPRWRGRRRRRIVGDQIVAEAELLLGLVPDRDRRSIRSAIVHPRAQIGDGTTVGPHATIGAHVRIGANCRIGASAVVDGWTEIGDDTRDLSVRVDRPGAAGPQVPRRADAPDDRRAATSSASSSPSTAARAAAAA